MDLSSLPRPGSGPTGSRTTTWPAVTGAGPEHSRNYIARWENLEAEGRDIVGEARLVDALAPRSARILDAGAGTGRIAAWLAARGHRVTAVDIDPALVGYARDRYADVDVDWHVGDLAVDSGDGAVPAGPFDVIVSAGNVLAFIPGAAHRTALGVLASRLAPDGRLVVGFGLNRGRSAESFLADAAAAGLTADQMYSSWDLRPFTASDGFLVAVSYAEWAVEQEPAQNLAADPGSFVHPGVPIYVRTLQDEDTNLRLKRQNLAQVYLESIREVAELRTSLPALIGSDAESGDGPGEVILVTLFPQDLLGDALLNLTALDTVIFCLPEGASLGFLPVSGAEVWPDNDGPGLLDRLALDEFATVRDLMAASDWENGGYRDDEDDGEDGDAAGADRD